MYPRHIVSHIFKELLYCCIIYISYPILVSVHHSMFLKITKACQLDIIWVKCSTNLYIKIQK